MHLYSPLSSSCNTLCSAINILQRKKLMQRGTNELQRPHIEDLAMEGDMKGYQP